MQYVYVLQTLTTTIYPMWLVQKSKQAAPIDLKSSNEDSRIEETLSSIF